MKPRLSICLFFLWKITFTQNYTSYLTGNSSDLDIQPFGGICLMGGATEDDNAMKWFLNRANGGDVLVLRASGSNGYNSYMYSQLGISLNSVETIVFNNSNASNESYIHTKIMQAEAIWFAGGDQWDYIDYWRNTPIDSLINAAIQTRNIAIGGTSAGMAIQGNYYFSAENGTVYSSTALANPYDAAITLDSLAFIQNVILSNVITDTHFDNPDRKGRLVTFLARILMDYNFPAKAIACDEYTAVCIDTNGIAQVYGEYPSYDDNAYFIQVNCELTNMLPETCMPDSALTWNLNANAIKVYKVKGTSGGSNTFNVNDWQNGNGGNWENWYVNNGTLYENSGAQPNCIVSYLYNTDEVISEITIFPNPFVESLTIQSKKNSITTISLFDLHGNKIIEDFELTGDSETINLKELKSGVYLIKAKNNVLVNCFRIIKI